MWIDRKTYDRIEALAFQNTGKLASLECANILVNVQHETAKVQNAKQEVTIDWMRHRINALEKERAILLKEVTHLSYPVPEIALSQSAGPVKSSVFANVKTSNTLPGFDSLPSFEDIGDDLATAQGITHKEDGTLEYRD